MNDRPTYRKWVGVLLGLLLNGSAHFLSGARATGVRWYFGILLCGCSSMIVAIPGTLSYIIGIMGLIVALVLWFVMLKQSYRPVPRIGFLGWLVVVGIAVTLNIAERFLIHQVVHPFKVTTGSMQPTILGIQARDMPVNAADCPGVMDWLISGQEFLEVKVSAGGTLSGPYFDGKEPSMIEFDVASHRYSVPRSARLRVRYDGQVSAGDVLWSGVVTVGDHLMVERVTCRFVGPKRGDIIVFRTDGIKSLPQDTFYVERVAGLPGERIRIEPPNLIVNGREVTEPAIFRTISSQSDGYAGFQLAQGAPDAILSTPTNEIVLGQDQYLVLGDNTRNSRDSRYWGAVPRTNIMGKVTRIYWPFTRINVLEGK